MLFTVEYITIGIALPHSYGINFICAGLKKGLKVLNLSLKSPVATLGSYDAFFKDHYLV